MQEHMDQKTYPLNDENIVHIIPPNATYSYELLNQVRNCNPAESSMEAICQLIRRASYDLPTCLGVEGEAGFHSGNVEGAIEMLEITFNLIANYGKPLIKLPGIRTCNFQILCACARLMCASMPALALLTFKSDVVPSLDHDKMNRLMRVYTSFRDHAISLVPFTNTRLFNLDAFFTEGPRPDPLNIAGATNVLLIFEFCTVIALYARFPWNVRAYVPDHSMHSRKYFEGLMVGGKAACAFVSETNLANDAVLWQMFRANELVNKISDLNYISDGFEKLFVCVGVFHISKKMSFSWYEEIIYSHRFVFSKYTNTRIKIIFVLVYLFFFVFAIFSIIKLLDIRFK
jgi:hypothetical protein